MKQMLFLVLVVFTGVLFAEEKRVLTEEKVRGLIKSVHIRIVDEVTDNCWTNIEHVQRSAELIFQKNKIHVSNNPLTGLFMGFPRARRILISSLGYRDGNGVCVGGLTITSSVLVVQSVEGTNGKINSGIFASEIISNYIFSASKNLNSSINQGVEEGLTKYVNEIYKARQDPLVKEAIAVQDRKDKEIAEFSELMKKNPKEAAKKLSDALIEAQKSSNK